VHGLPEIGQVGQLCEACRADKQRRTSFPEKAEYRAERCLELVHGDLCSPISPATSRGNKYFLLLVDDLSRYMWVAAIPSKDRAVAAIKDIQAWAEGEFSLKLKALHTDRGGHASSAHDVLQRASLAHGLKLKALHTDEEAALDGGRRWLSTGRCLVAHDTEGNQCREGNQWLVMAG
jgi:hypothetical protein